MWAKIKGMNDLEGPYCSASSFCYLARARVQVVGI